MTEQNQAPDERRRNLLQQIAKRDVNAIYNYAMQRSAEIKRGALEDPEFEDKVIEDASYALSSPQAKSINRYVSIALAMCTDEIGLAESRILVKRMAMDLSPEEIDNAREYMYNSGQWERPDDGE